MTFHLGHFLYDGYSCSMKYIPFIIQQAAKDHKLPQKKTETLFFGAFRFFIRHPSSLSFQIDPSGF
ncbi:hypothetical protein CHCC14821_2596 [Bacillus paralicheniformis]|nr:hypothetical protein CHCC14821_2596 [Bacillus paralicheniformis]